MEQRKAALAVREAILTDLKIKGSKRKKVNHWRKVACQAIGISKMGAARWQRILDYGYDHKIFELQEVGTSKKAVLHPLDVQETQSTEPELIWTFSDLDPTKTLIEPTKDEFETQALPPHLLDGVKESDLPQPGDMMFYRSYQGQVVQGEILAARCVVDVRNPDGTYQTVLLSDLHDSKKGVSRVRGNQQLTAYYLDNTRLRRERDQLLQEIESLKTKLVQS
tara:strand:+ start:573 stop:1238 length:666 start_codon:yes stop_codon:yes gene_type:complete